VADTDRSAPSSSPISPTNFTRRADASRDLVAHYDLLAKSMTLTNWSVDSMSFFTGGEDGDK
jgi:hypothetical protein